MRAGLPKPTSNAHTLQQTQHSSHPDLRSLPTSQARIHNHGRQDTPDRALHENVPTPTPYHRYTKHLTVRRPSSCPHTLLGHSTPITPDEVSCTHSAPIPSCPLSARPQQYTKPYCRTGRRHTQHARTAENIGYAAAMTRSEGHVTSLFNGLQHLRLCVD